MNIIKAKKYYIMILAIMFVVISLSDTTYSLFFQAESTDDFTYNTGILDLQFVEDEQISIQNAFPMVDSKGMETEPYTLTIKNTGSLPYLFDLKMLSVTDENVLDMRYIKFQVNNLKSKTLYETGNVIESNIILYPNEEKTFNIRVWLDINIPNGEFGKTFMAKLVTTGEAIYRTLDTSGANYPELVDGMIPVYYDESVGVWKKADSSNTISSYEWYNYDNQKWANVVNIVSSNKEIYDVLGKHNLVLNTAKTNNRNFITDDGYLDINISNYNYKGISNIFRIKFNDLNNDKIYIISNDKISYYYDTKINKFVFVTENSIVFSNTFKLEEGNWYILGYTYDKNVVSFYVNGNKISTANIIGTLYSNESFKIGTDITFSEISNFELGDIYIYNDILSSDLINKNYSTTINIVYDNLFVGYNDFEPKTLREFYMSQDIGSVIKNEDIMSHYVWIPRYKYKLWNVTGTPGVDSYDAYRMGIDIIFEKNKETSGVIRCENNICYNDDLLITKVTNNDNDKYYTHPAFTYGDEELTGIWVSKYEISTSDEKCNGLNIDGCISNVLDIQSKNKNLVWRNNYLSYFYKNIKKLGDNAHMIKNTEWGALTYLTHSKYGLCDNNNCKTIGVNKTYISGNELKDSTTYNMYGVFDLAGSSAEFVMSNYTIDKKLVVNGTHFDDIEINKNDYNLYYDGMFILGDATKEISLVDGNWYNNYGSFINETNNWFIRGGIGITENTGIFYYNATTDINNEHISTRVILK